MASNYYIIDSFLQKGNVYNIKDDSGNCLFYYVVNEYNKRLRAKLFDSNTKEIILSINEEGEVGNTKYKAKDHRDIKVFEVFKNMYFTTLEVKGIFGDFSVTKPLMHKRNFDISKNGIIVGKISADNKYCDNYLSLEVFKEEFSFVLIVLYLLIDINKFFGRY